MGGGCTTGADYTVRHAVFDFFRSVGIDTIFGNPGSTELAMLRDFPSDFKYVLALQECVVMGMADGYAQISKNASVVNLHSAAGLGHALGNLFTAFKNKTPLVVTAGQQARSLLPFDPYLGATDAATFPRPYVKWSVEPARAEDVPQAIAKAYHIAMTEPRGPVFVSIPSDDWDVNAQPLVPRTVSYTSRADDAMLRTVAERLNRSARPAFVVGDAVDRAGAWDSIVQLAEAHRANVYVAPMSGRCSFPENHPLWSGFLPPMRERIVGQLAGHDLVFVVGAPVFTYHVPGHGPFVPDGTEVLQLTEDATSAAAAPVGIAVVGSIQPALAELIAAGAPAADRTPLERQKPPRVARPNVGQRMPVAWVLQAITDLKPANSVIVEEAPSARPVIHRHLPITRAGGFYTMSSGGLGYGLPAAVGISLADPSQRVIALIGDGSAMYAVQALWSAAQLNLPLAILILRNRKYGALDEFARIFGFREDEKVVGTELPGIDFPALATAQGVRALRAATPSELEAALHDALGSATPVLVEIEIE